ncbi:MAG TPA: class I SAM-dependent methyltransferase [Chloroflexia bacterium]
MRQARQGSIGGERSGTEVTSKAFSQYAPYYDAEQHGNVIARWTRARNLHVLRGTFGPGERVLEIGCGTGEEALYLAARGVEVLATDPAEGMIEVVRAKVAVPTWDGKSRGAVTPQVLAAHEIARLLTEYGRASFAGAYSSFGPLNCEPDLRPVVSALADLVQPRGKVVISLLNRYCAWETLWHLVKLQPQTAFRRWGGYAEATVRAQWGDQRIPVYYWTPGAVEHLFSQHFVTTRRTALTWAIPPPYLERLVKGRARLFRRLARAELRLGHRWPFNALGDHVILEMERKPK